MREQGCNDSVISHVCAVSHFAKKIALELRACGHGVDVDFVETSAILHDIGRSRTQGILHGVQGASILRARGFEGYARVCERHIGAGIIPEEARELGLPEGQYVPFTLEEKIVAHADNLVHGNKIVSIEKSLERFSERLGKDHPAVFRVKQLNDFISCLYKK